MLGRWSRLLIDLNRGADDPTLVMKLSDGSIIPGNRDVDEAEVAARIAEFHAPYHAAITRRAGPAGRGYGGDLAAQLHAVLEDGAAQMGSGRAV